MRLELGPAILGTLLLCGGCQDRVREPAPTRVAGESLAGEDHGPGDIQEKPAPGTKTEASDSDPEGDGTAERHFQGIRFNVPAAWVEQPASEFYEAKYVIPAEQGEMTLTMTTMGGGIEQNLARWVGQFQREAGDKPRRETLLVGGTRSQWLDVRGTFRSRVGNNPGPHRGWRLLGVAIPMQPRDFLIKLIGPRPAIAAFQEEFRQFVRSGTLDE